MATCVLISHFLSGLAKPAQPPGDFNSRTPPRIRARLAQLEELVQNRQWDEAIETVRELMEGEPHILVPMVESTKATALGFQRFESLEARLQRQLLQSESTAPELLKLYRDQIDSTARHWLAQARQTGDMRLLARIRDEFLASSVAPDACWELGERAFREGRFLEARNCWQRFDPASLTPNGQPAWLALLEFDQAHLSTAVKSLMDFPSGDRRIPTFSDHGIPLAEVRARLGFVSLMADMPSRAKLTGRILNSTTPEARGAIFKSDGLWLAHLTEALEESSSGPKWLQNEWRSFAGNSTRASKLPPIDWQPKLLWTRPLPKLLAPNAVGRNSMIPISESWDHLLVYFPIGVGRRVYWSQPGSWHVVDLQTGSLVSQSNSDDKSDSSAPRTQLHHSDSEEPRWMASLDRYGGVPRFSLHAQERHLIGVNRRLQIADEDAISTTRTDCVTVWNLQSARIGHQIVPSEGWHFSGPPVSDHRNIYVMERHQDSVQTSLRVAAFSLTGGQPVWRTAVTKSRAPSSTVVWSNDHLTLNENLLIVQTHAGVVAGLDTEKGRTRWLLEYPRLQVARTSANPLPHRTIFRRGNACFVHHDIAVFASADCQHVFAVDANHGNLLWATPP